MGKTLDKINYYLTDYRLGGDSYSAHRKKMVEKNKFSYVNPIYGCGATIGGVLSQSPAMSISAFFRGVDLISSTIATLPIEVKRKRTGQEDTDKNHPVNLIFQNRDGSLVNRYNGMKWMVQSIILKGNAYAYIYRAEDGTPIRLRVLDASDVTVHYSKENYILYYQSTLIKGVRQIPPEDMIHLYNWTFNGVEGVSLLKFMQRTIQNANNTEDSASGYYGGKMSPNGIITVTGPTGDAQRNQIRDAFQQSFQGNNGAGVAILQGNMTYQQISTNAEEAQLLQNRQFNVLDIARFLGINPILLGDLSHASYSTLEAVQQDFLTHTLMPYIDLIEEEFSRKLLKQNERGVRINLDETAILLSDKSATASYYTQLINAGILSINEVREKLGYNSIGEDGDKHIIPYTDTSMNDVANNSPQEENKLPKKKVKNDKIRK